MLDILGAGFISENVCVLCSIVGRGILPVVMKCWVIFTENTTVLAGLAYFISKAVKVKTNLHSATSSLQVYNRKFVFHKINITTVSIML